VHPDIHAYIDPNSGGMLFQILAVAFAFFSGILLVFSGRIRMTIARWRRKAREGDQPVEGETPPPVDSTVDEDKKDSAS
jgi:hypothetical protein